MNNKTKKRLAAGILAVTMAAASAIVPSFLYADTPTLEDKDITEPQANTSLPTEIQANKIMGCSFVKQLSSTQTEEGPFNVEHGANLYYVDEFSYNIPWTVKENADTIPLEYTHYIVTLDSKTNAPLYCIDLNAKPPVYTDENDMQSSYRMVLNNNGFSKIALADITTENIESSTMMLAPLLYGYPIAQNKFPDLTNGEYKWSTSMAFKLISGKAYNPSDYTKSDGINIKEFYQDSLLSGISAPYIKNNIFKKQLANADWETLYNRVLIKASGVKTPSNSLTYCKTISGYSPETTHSGEVVGTMSMMLYGAYDIAVDSGNYERTLHLESPTNIEEKTLEEKTYIGPYIAHINQGTLYSSKNAGKDEHITNTLLKDTILVSIDNNPSNTYIGKADGTPYDKEGNNYLVNTEEEFYVFNTNNETKEYSISLTPKNIQNIKNGYYQSDNTVQVPTQRMIMYSPIPLTGKFKAAFTEKEVLGSLKLTKVNSIDKKPIVGAVFTLTSNKNIIYKGVNVPANTPIDGEKTSTTTGVISWDSLPVGTYTLSETKSPDGYQTATYTSTIEITKDNLNIDKGTVENTPYGSIAIHKVNGVTNENISGVKFNVLDSTGKTIATMTTDANGNAKTEKNLVPGIYKLKEVTPAGYLENGEVEVVVKADSIENLNPQKEIKNYPTGKITIIKKDKISDETLAGAEFKIIANKAIKYKDKEIKQGESLGTFTTDENGSIIVDSLPYAVYTITETKAPTGYQASSFTQNVEISSDSLKTLYVEVEVTNIPLGKISIVKTDSITDDKLKGAEFSIITNSKITYNNKEYNANDEIAKITTDNNGLASIDSLPYGKYTVIETKAPEGYQKPDFKAVVDISGSTEETLYKTIDVKNTPLGKLTIIKIDASTKEKLAGAEFEISTNNNIVYGDKNYQAGDVIIKAVTDNDGVIEVENLPCGTYTVVETKAPDEYQIDKTPKTVIISEGSKTTLYRQVEIPNTHEGSLKVIKTDAITEDRLPGAVFEIITKDGTTYNNNEYGAGETIATLTSNDGGEAVIEHLEPGVYIVKEKTAPDGYSLNEKEFTVTIGEHDEEVPTVEVSNISLGKLSIKKYVEGFPDITLAGAKFNLYLNNEIVATLITDDEGKASVDNLEYGEYQLKEIEAPKNYQLLSDIYTFEIKKEANNESLSYHFDIPNKSEEGSFSIFKTNPNSEKPIVAKFDLFPTTTTYYNGNIYDATTPILEEFQTNTDGKYISPTIPVGTYKLIEVETENGYILPDEGQMMATIEITSESDTKALEFHIINFEKDVFGQFEIYKVDKTTKEKLPNAKFEITNDAGELIDTVITDENGIAKSGNLTYGVYYVQEISAPEGYILSTEKHKVEITGQETAPVILEVENEKDYGKIKVIKVDANDNTKVIPNVSFEIYNENNELVDKVNTDHNGEAISKNLDFGKYYIKEVTTPSGYVINTKSITVELTKDNSIQGTTIKTVIVENTPIQGIIKVIKIEKDNRERTLPGAQFDVYDENGKLIQKLTTDENGEASTNKLPLGKYTIKETQAPNGYVRTNTPFEVELTEGDKTSPVVYTSLKVENKKVDVYYYGKIELIKIDSKTNAVLSGAEFEVTAGEDIYEENKVFSKGDVVCKLITDANGKANTNILPVGTYIIRETKAPEGYLISLEKHTVTLTANSNQELSLEVVTIKNEKEEIPLGRIEIIKKDSLNKKAIADVTFEIYTKNPITYNGISYAANQLVQTIKTDDDGIAITDNLPLGEYYAIETGVYEGYKVNNKKYDFLITQENHTKVQNQTVYNTPTEVVITKYDITNSKPLEGATITIYDSKGKKVYEDETDENGEITVFRLKPGKYTFEETAAPDGYIINDIVFEFSIDENGKVKGDNEVSDKPTEVIITKKDLTTGLPLAGATITIVDSNGKIVFNEVSGPNGEVKAMHLKPGKYTFTETAAPDGYTRNPESFEFELFEDGTVRGDCTITDRPTEVIITKKDFTTGAPLAGATIEIKDINGNVVFKEVSGPNGEVKAMKLKPGKYTFTETAAPDGYTRNPETFEFELYEDGTVKGDCTITDRPTEVIITKKDFTNASPLPGATIQIIDSNGKLAFEGVTGEDGTIRAFKLSPGKYTFKEISAPEGYQLNVETFNFELFEDGTVKGDHEIYDKRIPNVKTGVESEEKSHSYLPVIIAFVLIAVCGIVGFTSKKNKNNKDDK